MFTKDSLQFWMTKWIPRTAKCCSVVASDRYPIRVSGSGHSGQPVHVGSLLELCSRNDVTTQRFRKVFEYRALYFSIFSHTFCIIIQKIRFYKKYGNIFRRLFRRFDSRLFCIFPFLYTFCIACFEMCFSFLGWYCQRIPKRDVFFFLRRKGDHPKTSILS